MSHVAAIGSVDAIANLTGGAASEQVRSQVASWNLFETLGLHFSVGRGFVPADEQEVSRRSPSSDTASGHGTSAAIRTWSAAA